jgi:hypothetical protein
MLAFFNYEVCLPDEALAEAGKVFPPGPPSRGESAAIRGGKI